MAASDFFSVEVWAGAELVAAVPEIGQFARVRVEQISNAGSSNMSLAIWRTLAARIDAVFRAAANIADVVITHGTNTIEGSSMKLSADFLDTSGEIPLAYSSGKSSRPRPSAHGQALPAADPAGESRKRKRSVQ